MATRARALSLGVVVVSGLFCAGCLGRDGGDEYVSAGFVDEAVAYPKEANDQGSYGYCTAYALTNFLDAWAREFSGSKVRLDEAFTTLAGNLFKKDESHYRSLVWYATMIYGAVPQGAKKVSGEDWPPENWQDLQKEKLIPVNDLGVLLGGQFEHADVDDGKPFTAPEFLSERVGIDMSDFRFFRSNGISKVEKKKASASSEENKDDNDFRYGDSSTSSTEAVKEHAKSVGLDMTVYLVSPDVVYRGLKAQIYGHMPVLTTLDVGQITSFSSQKVVGAHELKKEEAPRSGHAVVAIGHCETDTNNREELCQPFLDEMAKANIPECVVFLNSWGNGAHDSARVCISKKSLRRMLDSVTLRSDIFSGLDQD